MTNQLKAHFSSLGETFTIELVPINKATEMYWVVDEEKDTWFAVTNFPSSTMLRVGDNVYCHSIDDVLIGRVLEQ